MQTQIKPLLAEAGKTPTTVANEVVDDVLVPGLSAEIRDMRALEPPAALVQSVDAVVGAIERTIGEAKQDPLGFVRNVRSLAYSEKVANKHGLTACGRI